MEQYEIFITDKAFVDMEQIYEYIAGQLLAPQTALHQYRRIAEEILSLNIFQNEFVRLTIQEQRSIQIQE